MPWRRRDLRPLWMVRGILIGQGMREVLRGRGLPRGGLWAESSECSCFGKNSVLQKRINIAGLRLLP